MSEDRLMELARAAGYAFAAEDDEAPVAQARGDLPRDVLFPTLKEAPAEPGPLSIMQRAYAATVPAWVVGRA
jgi:hypothetical protein